MTGSTDGNGLSPWAYGDPETTGAVQNSRLMEPAVTNYLNRVFTGQIAEEGLSRLAGPKYDFSKTFAQNALDPARMEANIGVALGFGPGIIAGPQAVGALLRGGANEPMTLENAIRMESGSYPYNAPMDRDAIFKQTGWFRGVDQQWRFIIPDKGAELNKSGLEHIPYTSPGGFYSDMYGIPSGGAKLGDILNHDDLYAAYPWTRNIDVKPMDPGLMGDYNGGYNHDINTMWISPRDDTDMDRMLSVIMHETQHAVQHVEGFARGGNVSEFLPPSWNEDSWNNAIERSNVRTEIENEGYDPEKVGAEWGIFPYQYPLPSAAGHSAGLDPDIISRYQSAQERYGDLTAQQNAANKNYRNLAGEVESRVTEAMLHNQAWDLPPWEMGEITHRYLGGPRTVPYTPESQQIVKFDQPGSVTPDRPEPSSDRPELPPLPEGYGYEPVYYDPFADQPGGG